MTDRIERGVSDLEQVDVPVTWSDVEARLGAPATPDVDARTRRRVGPRAAIGVIAVAAALIVAIVIVSRPDDRVVSTPSNDDRPTIDTTTPPDPNQRWRTIAASPLAARTGAAATWTGTEMVVVGGRSGDPCPPTARCLPSGENLNDGAAYNPTTDSWRRIADAPADQVYSATWIGARVVVTARVGEESRFLAYEPEGDRWLSLQSPPGRWAEQLVQPPVWTEYGLVISVSQTPLPVANFAYDPIEQAWVLLPDPGFGCESEQYMAWTGARLVKFARSCGDVGTTPVLLNVWSLDPRTMQWTQEPSGKVQWPGPWFEIDGLLVNPTPGTVDGGEVNPYPEPHPNGGTFDQRTGTWGTLPELPPPSQSFIAPPLPFDGVVGRWVAMGSNLYDPTAREWHVVREERPGVVDAAAAVSTGDEVIVWGGSTRDYSRFVSTGAIYTPPA